MEKKRKFTSKTKLAQQMNWPIDFVETFLGTFDYIFEPSNPYPKYSGFSSGIPMYSIEIAELYANCPEEIWRKVRKVKKAPPKEPMVEKWKEGPLKENKDIKDAIFWAVGQVREGQLSQALEVVQHFNEEDRDAFYGLVRNYLEGANLRKVVRTLDLSGQALLRHGIRALRTSRSDEAAVLMTRPAFKKTTSHLPMKTAIVKNKMSLFRHIAKHFPWNREEHEEAAADIAFSLVNRRHYHMLSLVPIHWMTDKQRTRLLGNFIERSKREGAKENVEEFLAWARGVWTDKDILISLVELSQGLKGGGQHANVVNFIKLFENTSTNLPGFDAKTIKVISTALRKDLPERGAQFRAMVFNIFLGEVGYEQEKVKNVQTTSIPPARPKM